MFGLDMAPGAVFGVLWALRGPQAIMENCLAALLGQSDVILADLFGLLDFLDDDFLI